MGAGGQAVVLAGKAVYTSNSDTQQIETLPVAIKTGNGNQKEIAILKKINSPHVVEPLNDPSITDLVMHRAISSAQVFMSKLCIFLNNSAMDDSLKTYLFLNFSIQILTGLKDTHSAGYAHCDLKPANILLFPTNRFCLCDYGSATSPLENNKIPAITPSFAAPEFINMRVNVKSALFDSKVDVWSFGAIIYYLIFGTNYFDYKKDSYGSFDSNNVADINKYLKDHQEFFPQHLTQRVDHLPQGLKNVVTLLINDALQIDPLKRSGINGLLDICEASMKDIGKILGEKNNLGELEDAIKSLWREWVGELPVTQIAMPPTTVLVPTQVITSSLDLA